MESLRNIIFIIAILNLVNAQVPHGHYQRISYRRSPVENNNDLRMNVLNEFDKTFWNNQENLAYRNNPEVNIGEASVIDEENENNKMVKRMNPLKFDNTIGLYDLKNDLASGGALIQRNHLVHQPLTYLEEAHSNSEIAKPNIALFRQRRINSFNEVKNNLALPWNKEENHKHISTTSYRIHHRKGTHSISSNVGATHMSSSRVPIRPPQDKFEEIGNTNKASELIKQSKYTNTNIDALKSILRMDNPSLDGNSFITDSNLIKQNVDANGIVEAPILRMDIPSSDSNSHKTDSNLIKQNIDANGIVEAPILRTDIPSLYSNSRKTDTNLIKQNIDGNTNVEPKQILNMDFPSLYGFSSKTDSKLIKPNIDTNTNFEPSKPISRYMDIPNLYGHSLKTDSNVIKQNIDERPPKSILGMDFPNLYDPPLKNNNHLIKQNEDANTIAKASKPIFGVDNPSLYGLSPKVEDQLIKQNIYANAIVEPPKATLTMDIPSLYDHSLETDLSKQNVDTNADAERPILTKTFLPYRRSSYPLKVESLNVSTDAENRQSRKPNNKYLTNLKERIVTDFIIDNFVSEDMAHLISSAKTKEEKENVMIAIKNYEMLTHALINFIHYSKPQTGYINSLKLISENKQPGKVATYIMEEVFGDESKPRNGVPSESEKAVAGNDEPNVEPSSVPTSNLEEDVGDESKGLGNKAPDENESENYLDEKEEDAQDINNGSFHIIHDHRKKVPDTIKSEREVENNDENTRRTFEGVGKDAVVPLNSDDFLDHIGINNTIDEPLKKTKDNAAIEPKKPLGSGPRKTQKRIKTLEKEELEEFMASLQIHKKIDEAFCEKLKLNEALNVMESIIKDFIEDLSYRFDKDVIMITAEFSVNRNLRYQRDGDQDCYYY